MSRFLRSVAILLATGLALACGGSPGGQETEAKAEADNLLLVTLDTTRADRFGCYGHTPSMTPRFDALAADGIRFDRAISAAAVTPVSHASILTGLYPWQHGLRVLYAGSHFRLQPGVPTLATELQKAGWKTGAMLSSFTVSEWFGFDRGFDAFDAGLQAPADRIMAPAGDGSWKWDVNANQRRSDQTTDRAIDWLGRTKGRFFLWVHYWDPHDNVLVPPPEWLGRFGVADAAGPEALRRLYDAEIAFMDEQFGRLVDALKAAGRYDRTAIVVVADHGEGLGDHDWWHHRILYQEQIRVPLILRLPGGPRGRSVNQVVRTVDILPTALESLGQTPPSVAGESLAGFIRGTGQPGRIAYSDALNLFDLNAKMIEKRPYDDVVYGAVDGQWKLVWRPRHPERSELFDLDADPGERRSVLEADSGVAMRLQKWIEASGGIASGPFGAGEDREALERLRSLGYLGGGPAPSPAPPTPGSGDKNDPK